MRAAGKPNEIDCPPIIIWMQKETHISHKERCAFWQGQKDSNPRPAVLETAALPAELYPYLNVAIT